MAKIPIAVPTRLMTEDKFIPYGLLTRKLGLLPKQSYQIWNQLVEVISFSIDLYSLKSIAIPFARFSAGRQNN